MSDEHPVDAGFADETDDGPSVDEAQTPPKAGVALSVLWWIEGEPERDA
jgi:hypothetical protein